MATRPRSVPRRILTVVAVVAVAVVASVVAFAVLLDSGAVTNRVVQLVVPRASEALGREVRVRDAELDLVPTARVALRGLEVAGRSGEPPLVGAESLDVAVALWPLLRSLGDDIEVHALTLVRPLVNLVRAKDGTWSHEGLGAGSRGAAEEPPPQGGATTRIAVHTVRVEGAIIRIVDRAAGADDAGIALGDLDLDASGVGPGLPLEVRLAAAFASDRQNLHARISVARLPDGIPQRARDWPAVEGSLTLGALPLDRLRPLLPGELGSIVRGGSASFDAKVSTGARQTYRVEGGGELEEVRLRGQPASGRFRAAASWTPAKPDGARVDVTELAVRGPGVELGGHASLDTSPLRAWFVVTGPLLDLDAVMGLLPAGEEEATPAQEGELLPASMRRQLRAATVRGTIAIGEVRSGRLTASDVKARVALRNGVLALETLDAAMFGGRVSAGGTEVALGEREPSWKLAAKLAALDLGSAMQSFTGAQPLVGKLSGTLRVAGRGTDWETLRDGLTGLATLALRDGALTTTDVGDRVLGGLAAALEASGRAGAARRMEDAQGGRTELRELSGDFGVNDGFLAARAPLRVETPFGRMSLGGGVGLDGRLDLEGAATVPTAAVAGVPGRLPLPDTLDVPLALGGTLGAPTVSVRAGAAVAGLARRQARQATKSVRDEAERRGRRAVGDVLRGTIGEKERR
jgi:AsmA protein